MRGEEPVVRLLRHYDSGRSAHEKAAGFSDEIKRPGHGHEVLAGNCSRGNVHGIGKGFRRLGHFAEAINISGGQLFRAGRSWDCCASG